MKVISFIFSIYDLFLHLTIARYIMLMLFCEKSTENFYQHLIKILKQFY